MHPIFEDGYIAGIRDTYHAQLRAGMPHDEARERALREESLAPMPHTVSLLWIALAATQHELGHEDLLVRQCASDALVDERWLVMWADDEATGRALLDSTRRWLDEPIAAPARIEMVPAYKRDALKPALLEEIEAIAQRMRAEPLLASLGTAPAESVVAGIATALDALGEQRYTLEEEEVKRTRRRLAIAFAEVLRGAGWDWASAVDADGDAATALVSPDSSMWFYPLRVTASRVDDFDITINVLPALHRALIAGDVPAGPAGAMVDLRDYIERIADPAWPAAREAIITREASGQDPMAAMADAFKALGDLSGQDLSGLGDALSGMAKAAEAIKEARGGGSEEAGVKTPPAADAVARRALLLMHQLDHMLNSVPPEAIAAFQQGWPGDSKQRFGPPAAQRCEQRLAELESSGLAGDLDPAERKFLGTPLFDVPMPLLMQYSWRAENLHCLLWALGLDDLLPWDRQVGPGDFDLAALERSAAFVRDARLRPAAELDAVRDRAELWNWRSRTRQLQDKGRPFPATPGQGVDSWDGAVRFTMREVPKKWPDVALADEDLRALGKAYRDLDEHEFTVLSGIAQERHFAMNWLCGYAKDNRWSATPTGT